MRGKRAKQIRRLARAETVGAPLVAYSGTKRGSIELNAESTRSVVQRYKRVFHLMRSRA